MLVSPRRRQSAGPRRRRSRRVDSEILRDPTQLTASSIIAQVAQVTTLRVVLPWMIGRAFDKIGKEWEASCKLG